MTTLPPTDFMRRSLDEAATMYQEQLAGSQGEAYLLSRGLSKETVEGFRLGYVGSHHLPEHRHLRGRISIPYITRAGIVSMRFRIVPPDTSDAKYLGWKGITGKKLFNVNDLWTTQTLFICEGEIDAMTAHQVGLPAVGIAGVSNWNPEWWRIFRNRTVAILADSDDKGQGEGMASEIMEVVRDSMMIPMPSGHDVSSFVHDMGPQALLDLIEERMR